MVRRDTNHGGGRLDDTEQKTPRISPGRSLYDDESDFTFFLHHLNR